MSDSADRLAEELRKVAAAFDARLPQRMQQLAVLWKAYQQQSPDSAHALQRELHRLRGTVASYGYRTLSQRLREAEEMLERNAGQDLDASMRQLLAQQWVRDTPLA